MGQAPARSLRYRRADLGPDVVAGLTVAALLVPQSMAYAVAAGFPPVNALYASVLPLLVYAALGRSPVASIGPLISLNLVAATGISRVAAPGTADFAALGATLAVLVGVAHLLVWATRLARLARSVSQVALDGFLLAVAVVVVVSQLDGLLGLTDHHLDVVRTIEEVVSSMGSTRLVGLAIGATTFALMVGTRHMATFPSALVAVVLGSAAVWALGLGSDQVERLGSVPAGLPAPALPPWDHVVSLMPTALACTLLCVIEISAIERRFGDGPPPPREVAALGAANLASALFRGLPVTPVPTRTAIAAAAGARTRAAGAIAASCAALVLVAGTAALAYLPLPTLAAVAIVAALAFVRPTAWRSTWRQSRSRCALGLGVAAVTVLWGFEVGAVAVVVASVLDHLLRRESHTP